MTRGLLMSKNIANEPQDARLAAEAEDAADPG